MIRNNKLSGDFLINIFANAYICIIIFQVVEVVEVKDAADHLVEDEFKKIEEALNSNQSKTK